jgi:two-component system, OmpR family, response regulator
VKDSGKKILIVEDDTEIANVLADTLREEGYRASWASTGKEGWDDFTRERYDLVLVDLMLPEMDGYRLCEHIRLQSDVPLLIISARNEDRDKIKGLHIGADDYITKPFSLEEVKARIHAHLKRYERYRNTDEEVNTITHIDLCIYPEAQRVTIKGQTVNLTPKEYAILLLLVQNKGTVFSKQDIYEHVWHEDVFHSEQGVTVHMRSLRSKLGENVKQPRYRETVWGTGYRCTGETS